MSNAFVCRVDLFARFPSRNIVRTNLRWAVGAVRVKLVLGSEGSTWGALDFAIFADFPETEGCDVDEFSSLEEIAVGDRVDSTVAFRPERISFSKLKNLNVSRRKSPVLFLQRKRKTRPGCIFLRAKLAILIFLNYSCTDQLPSRFGGTVH